MTIERKKNMEKKLSDMFTELSDKKSLARIRTEIEATNTQVMVKRKGVERKETRRGRSQYVIDSIHEVVGDKHLDCNNAEGPCLNALIKHYLPQNIARLVVDALEVMIPALYAKLSVQSQWFSTISKTIQTKFSGDADLVQYTKEHLRLPKEARMLQQINYSAKVAKANAQQMELSDTQVLNIIAELRDAPADDYISKICLVGLCVGSRISEIVLVSEYSEADNNPRYIRVTGVSKDRSRSHSREEKKDEKAHGRTFVKPIIYLVSTDLIDIVVALRTQLELKYNWDLGRGHGTEVVDAKKVTSIVDAKANKRIRELFGESYVFHNTRAIYAQMAYVQYGPPGMSQTYFYSQVLGHQDNSLSTSLSYQTFAIRRKLKEDDPDLVTKITNLEVQLDRLQENKVVNHQKVEQLIHIAPSRNPRNAQGLSLELKKQPLIRQSQQDRLARLTVEADKIKAAGIRPTYRMLASLGFGGRVVNLYFKEQKRAK